MVDLSRKSLVATKVSQSRISCLPNEKDGHLFLLLKQHPGRYIIFCNAVSAVSRLRSVLLLLGVPVLALQGNMQQRARIKAMERFREQENAVLLATDVAARGLDVGSPPAPPSCTAPTATPVSQAEALATSHG